MEKLLAHAAKAGAGFSAMVAERQSGNPALAFLQAWSPHHGYWQYRLAAMRDVEAAAPPASAAANDAAPPQLPAASPTAASPPSAGVPSPPARSPSASPPLPPSPRAGSKRQRAPPAERVLTAGNHDIDAALETGGAYVAYSDAGGDDAGRDDDSSWTTDAIAAALRF